MTSVPVPKDAFALRPIRVLKNGRMRVYEAVTFPEAEGGPGNAIHMYLQRGMMGEPGQTESDLVVDILNENGDIIQDFLVTKTTFRYLQRTLKFRVTHEE